MIAQNSNPLVRGRSTVQSCAAAPQNPNKSEAFAHLALTRIVSIAQNVTRKANANPWKIGGLCSLAVPCVQPNPGD